MSFMSTETRRAPSARGTTGATTLAGVILLLILPGVAMAWRSPTPRERSAIALAAKSADGSHDESVHVRDIRVSGVGPWAAAVVTIYHRGTSRVEQAEQDTFYKAHGSWVDTASAGTPDLEMPLADERDLGLADSSGSGPLAFRIYLYVCWFFGLQPYGTCCSSRGERFAPRGTPRRAGW